MATDVSRPDAESAGQPAAPSAWSPLRNPVFRGLWIASIVSTTGTWMHDVGAAWLMTSLDASPLTVALLQTAASLPVFLLAIPAGALADVVDRRRLLLLTQLLMFAAAAGLGALTLLGLTTPWLLLAFTFALGVGTALNAPAWQAVTADVVTRAELPAAAALGGVGFNLARAIGPAVGGLVVAAAGPGAVFLLNAASFVAVVVAVYRWRRPTTAGAYPGERLAGAMRAGWRYARHAAPLRAVLVRTAAFIVPGSAVWALLPVVGRRELGLTALQYGVLLGCLGAGAVGGAVVLPRVRRWLSEDALVAAATVLWAGVAVALAHVRVYGVLCAVMAIGGVGWIALMSSLNAAAQTALPGWVRARGLAFYLLVFQGGMALGSVIWGVTAERAGTPTALLVAAGGLTAGLLTMIRYPLKEVGGLDLAASLHWPVPAVAVEPRGEDGPVLVLVEYRVDPAEAAEFVVAAEALEVVRRRDGAFRWGLFRDLADPGRWVETFLVESWAEHLRQHERHTVEDRAVEDRVRAFHRGDGPPAVSHLIWGRVSVV